jgi:hypothetical protein
MGIDTANRLDREGNTRRNGAEPGLGAASFACSESSDPVSDVISTQTASGMN